MDTDPQGSDPFDQLLGALGDAPAEGTADSGEPEPEQQPEDQPAEETTDAVEAIEEVEFDGKKLAIPAGTPPELVIGVTKLANDLKADYTRKTQEVAESRKSIEARSEAIQQQEALLSANFSKAVEYKALQDRLNQFEQIDWQALADSDPGQATKLNLAFQQLQRQAGKLYGELRQGHEQQQQLTAHQRQLLIEQGQRELQKRIPKWGAEVAKSITEKAQTYGFTADELSKQIDPRFVHVLHDAMQWQKLQEEKPKALQKVANAPKVLKPAASAPQKTTNQAAAERLKKFGRIEDLAKLL